MTSPDKEQERRTNEKALGERVRSFSSAKFIVDFLGSFSWLFGKVRDYFRYVFFVFVFLLVLPASFLIRALTLYPSKTLIIPEQLIGFDVR